MRAREDEDLRRRVPVEWEEVLLGPAKLGGTLRLMEFRVRSPFLLFLLPVRVLSRDPLAGKHGI